ncbi:MAG TPA: aminoacyl--tRNA ligase-related protein [Chthonomonadaceae bacterium]|nr:aminoacyl--tRNA ligase-related protein [Chthonomonadaceae bacterium]
MQQVVVTLTQPANEMVQEEICKKVAHLSKSILSSRFTEDGLNLIFEAPEEEAALLSGQAEQLARTVQRSLRNLQRKLVYRSTAADTVQFLGDGTDPGIHQLGNGQVALEDLPLRLYRYFDRIFQSLGNPWTPKPVYTPTLIPATVLAKCGYFRSFPHNVTFAVHLLEDAEQIDAFRGRHATRETLDEQALGDMDVPEACLTPATCYHVYHIFEGRTVAAGGSIYEVCGKCFRYEASNMRDLRRLWDFTMREIVFMGTKDYVLEQREQGIEIVSRFMEEHQVAGEIRTASDPFFIAPDASAKTYFQLSAETKYEISLMLPEEERLAVGSLNYHTDFFGRTFNVSVEEGGPMHSVCIAFGLERWVYAFLAQHGNQPERWPSVIRCAPEFVGLS